MTQTDQAPFDEHCIVELLGHRRLAGRVREVTLAGAGMLRLDIPATDGHDAQTQYISPGSLYALHPTTEAIATAAAARFRPDPVARWELKALDAAPLPAGPDPGWSDPDLEYESVDRSNCCGCPDIGCDDDCECTECPSGDNENRAAEQLATRPVEHMHTPPRDYSKEPPF